MKGSMSPRSILTPRPIVEEVVANDEGFVVGPPVSSVDALQIAEQINEIINKKLNA